MNNIVSRDLSKISYLENGERSDSGICASRVGWLKRLSWYCRRQRSNIHHISRRYVDLRAQLVTAGLNLKVSDTNESSSNYNQQDRRYSGEQTIVGVQEAYAANQLRFDDLSDIESLLVGIFGSQLTGLMAYARLKRVGSTICDNNEN